MTLLETSLDIIDPMLTSDQLPIEIYLLTTATLGPKYAPSPIITPLPPILTLGHT